MTTTDAPTIGELYKAKIVNEEKLVAAVDAYMADPTITHLVIAQGTVIDPTAAVRASAHATKILARADVRKESKRDAVRSAFLLAKAMGE